MTLTKYEKKIGLQHPNTLFVGKVLLRFASLPSTNRYAQELLTKSKPIEGTAVWADQQPLGVGQHGSRWESAPGQNLTLSLIFYPHFLPATRNFSLSQAVALAVRQTVASFLPTHPVTIKWPNDIYVGERKIAGLLIQNTIQGQQLASSIVGIGLNVNQVEFSADIPRPTSLQRETGRAGERGAVWGELAQALEATYLQLRAGQLEQLHAEYQKFLFRRGEVTFFQRPSGEVFAGKICGVTPAGLLHLEHDQGEAFFDLKEIGFVF